MTVAVARIVESTEKLSLTFCTGGATDAIGERLEMTWRDFCDRMTREAWVSRPEGFDKKSIPWFSFAWYRGNRRRRDRLDGVVGAVVLDLDKVWNSEGVFEALSEWEYLWWTTWNSTPAAPRMRFVLPIAGGIEADRFDALVKRISRKVVECGKLDPRSYLPEQLWFFPWHKEGNRDDHRIERHRGKSLSGGNVISVDFTGVKLVSRPEEIYEGSRNNTLYRRLHEPDALVCTSLDQLDDLAREWNERLPEPMKRREVRTIVRSVWKKFQTGEGLRLRAHAARTQFLDGNDDPLNEVGVTLDSPEIRNARIPQPLIGDFLFPGANMLSAKMKEGKSFLAMQVALAIASGEPFLKGPRHPGFKVHRREKAVVIAGEDDFGTMRLRFGAMLSSNVLVVLPDHLEKVRATYPDAVTGLDLFERLVDKWYKAGHRVICIDPLRVLEAALGIATYPGNEITANVWTEDFNTTRYYTRLAQKYHDLCFLISLHHGKNKQGQNKQDPQDMVVGTTGLGAGMVTMISLMPLPDELKSEDEEDDIHRRQLYVHGRYTVEKHLLIERGSDGTWTAVGTVSDEVMSKDQGKYFEAMLRIGAQEKFVSAEEISRAVGTKVITVHKVLGRIRYAGKAYRGWRLIIKKGPTGGYRLVC